MSKSKSVFISLKFIVVTLLLSGCGIRGDLYHPEEEATQNVQTSEQEKVPAQTVIEPSKSKEASTQSTQEDAIPVKKAQNVS